MSKVYAIANQKGGVGKTTVALCLAAALQQRSQRVLIVDLDPQAGATKVLDVDPSATDQPTMADLMLAETDHPIAEAVCPTDWGIDLAPSEIGLARKENERQPGDDLILRGAMQAEPLDYDVVLIDCPPQLGSLTVNALAAAGHLVLITEPSFVAQTGVGDLLETRDVIRRRLNPELQLAGVVVNLADHTREAKLRLQETAEFFGEALWEPPVPRRAVVREALAKGLPLHHPRAGRAAPDVTPVFEQLSRRIAA